MVLPRGRNDCFAAGLALNQADTCSNQWNKLVKRLRSIWFVVLGAGLLVFGTFGTLSSVLDLFGTSIQDFVEWDKQVPTEGFAPMVVPMDAEKSGLSAPELISTPEAIVTANASLTQDAQNQATPLPEVTPQPTPTRIMVIPDRIVIPAISLDAPIVPSKPSTTRIGSERYEQFQAPNKFAVGWQTDSAVLGQVGNTVLNGHHNINGKVFENLHNLQPGDTITISGGVVSYNYMVVNVMILPERNVDVQTRLENARWILQSDDERITLVTCWPATSNTHRLIVVAKPIGNATLASDQANP